MTVLDIVDYIFNSEGDAPETKVCNETFPF